MGDSLLLSVGLAHLLSLVCHSLPSITWNLVLQLAENINSELWLRARHILLEACLNTFPLGADVGPFVDVVDFGGGGVAVRTKFE